MVICKLLLTQDLQPSLRSVFVSSNCFAQILWVWPEPITITTNRLIWLWKTTTSPLRETLPSLTGRKLAFVRRAFTSTCRKTSATATDFKSTRKTAFIVKRATSSVLRKTSTGFALKEAKDPAIRECNDVDVSFWPQPRTANANSFVKLPHRGIVDVIITLIKPSVANNDCCAFDHTIVCFYISTQSLEMDVAAKLPFILAHQHLEKIITFSYANGKIA